MAVLKGEVRCNGAHDASFVLGSGFSASMGLPTLRNLFDGLMSDTERPGRSDKRQVLNALEFLYPHLTPNTSHRAYPPFEEFLSLVYGAQGFTFFGEGIWEANRRSALRLLTDHLARRQRRRNCSVDSWIGSTMVT